MNKYLDLSPSSDQFLVLNDARLATPVTIFL